MPTARTLENIAPLSFILSSGRKGTTYTQGHLMYDELSEGRLSALLAACTCTLRQMQQFQ